MKVAVGNDHAGFNLKNEIVEYLKEKNIEYKDFGCYDAASVDYPDFAKAVAGGVASGAFDKGILICSTGIGISIAANKLKGIRAALCTSVYQAKLSRLHNDANILCLGASVTGTGFAKEIADAFLNTGFSEDERHKRRIKKIED